MRIGLDFDGVIADTSSLKQEQAKLRYGVDIPTEIFKEKLVVGRGILTLEQYRSLMRSVCGTREIGLRMAPIGNSVDSLKSLQREGHDLLIITSREDSELEVARDWLAERGISIDFLSVGYGKDKVSAAEGLGAYIDDDLNKLLPLLNRVPRLFLLNRDYNATDEAPSGIARIDGWDEFLRHLSN
jgi:uncharacterized HAD superfamily protein